MFCKSHVTSKMTVAMQILKLNHKWPEFSASDETINTWYDALKNKNKDNLVRIVDHIICNSMMPPDLYGVLELLNTLEKDPKAMLMDLDL